jgi:predicted DNA-binding helix-hairpin-helix protein
MGKLSDLTSLRKLGVVVARAAPFLLLNGKRPATQLTMF